MSSSTDWVLGQFSGKRGKAEKDYQQFVQWGIGEKSVWTGVRGQALLGEDAFVDKLVDHLKKNKDIPGIPRSQRFATRPSLEKIFSERVTRDKRKRDRKIAEAVQKHGYRQSELARHLGLHTGTVSRLVRSVKGEV